MEKQIQLRLKGIHAEIDAAGAVELAIRDIQTIRDATLESRHLDDFVKKCLALLQDFEHSLGVERRRN